MHLTIFRRTGRCCLFLCILFLFVLNFLWFSYLNTDPRFEFPKTINHSTLSTWTRNECSALVSKLIDTGEFARSIRLPNRCPTLQAMNDEPRHVGCFYYDRAKPPLHLVYYNESQRNSRGHCVRACRWVGAAFAGLAEGSLCYCDRAVPSFLAPSLFCNTSCPAPDAAEDTCGGRNAIDIYATGVPQDYPLKPPSLGSLPPTVTLRHMSSISSDAFTDTRVVYVLVLTGRSWRQVQRMFRLLYHTSNYFYIHVDLKSEYLFSRCRQLEVLFPNNVHVTPNRHNPVWGAPSLLDLIITIQRDLFRNFPHWKWDFMINLSETDLPLMPVGGLIQLLGVSRGRIFVKQTSEETFKYINAEGLQYAFVQCGNYVWRVGVRLPIDGIVVHGGSDWLILPRDFAFYTAFANDSLAHGLRTWFANAILPVESFFHTIAHNSHFCGRVVDSNLRLTNWGRPRGCTCKANSVADWCGCSPAVFSGAEGLKKLRLIKNNEIAFGRKFDSTVDVGMVNYVEEKFLGRQLSMVDVEGRELYLESVYSKEVDQGTPSSYVDREIVELVKVACEFVSSCGVKSPFCQQFAGNNNVASRLADAFALFNSTASIGLNYTSLGEQLERYDVLPSIELPLRALNPPHLVLSLPEFEVLLRPKNALPSSPNSRIWIAPQGSQNLSAGDILYVEVNSGFDSKEVIFRNYLRFTPPSPLSVPVTVLVLWRELPKSSNTTGSIPPLKVHLFQPRASDPLCTFVLGRNPTKDAPYPGLPGFRATFTELDAHNCSLKSELNDRTGVWKVSVNAHVVHMNTLETGRDIWEAVDVCEKAACGEKVWSASRVDRKCSLGQFDAATGLLSLEGETDSPLDIAI